MASLAQIQKTKQANKKRKRGRKRKNRQGKKSTLSAAELFGDQAPPQP